MVTILLQKYFSYKLKDLVSSFLHIFLSLSTTPDSFSRLAANFRQTILTTSPPPLSLPTSLSIPYRLLWTLSLVCPSRLITHSHLPLLTHYHLPLLTRSFLPFPTRSYLPFPINLLLLTHLTLPTLSFPTKSPSPLPISSP